MKLKQIIIGIVMVLCAGAGIFALTKLHKSGTGGDDDAAPPENVTPLISVQTGTLKRTTLHSYISSYGTVEPMPATPNEPSGGGVLAAPMAGIVTRVAGVAGQQVKQGDVLVELDSAAATHAYAKAEVERQKQLFAGQNTSLKNLQDAEAQLAALEIRAPVSGTVTRITARLGAAVDANTVVAEVIDLDRLGISAQVPSSQADGLKTGQDVEILTSTPLTTTLGFISPAVDTNDGTVLLRASLASNSGLRPGEFVPLRIVTAAHTNCLAAPAESVVTGDDGKSFVVLVKGDEGAQVPVTTGLRENGWVEIAGGDLKEGDSVVTVGAYGFPDKAKIRAENSTAADSTSTNSAAPEK
ncbi:MAG TPA: efflux RND transporter periplasmic adaptor subunit [Verrucomicrobiae bacterium]|jgi:membrane fusion protein (multidrug efflux system)|nr:efflux RND transporter periplasmic adaptor subunit [Verrucomicrobiae bacterium]